MPPAPDPGTCSAWTQVWKVAEYAGGVGDELKRTDPHKLAALAARSPPRVPNILPLVGGRVLAQFGRQEGLGGAPEVGIRDLQAERAQ